MKRGPRRRVAGKAEKPKVDWKALDIMHPDAAGIDIGGSEHWVAISPERDPEPVRCFDCFTADMERMAVWLIDAECVAWPCSRPECTGFRFSRFCNSGDWRCIW